VNEENQCSAGPIGWLDLSKNGLTDSGLLVAVARLQAGETTSWPDLDVVQSVL